MTTQQKIQFDQVRKIVVAWSLAGVFIAVYDYFLLHSNIFVGDISEYSFAETLLYNTLAGFLSGIGGGIYVVRLNQRVKSKPYSYGLIMGFIGFITIFISISLLVMFITVVRYYGLDLSNAQMWAILKSQVLTTLHLKNIIFWGTVITITQFTLQISEKFGPGNLWNLLSGKYHTPQNEPRIFMFLDLKASTTIAEKLGESTYHKFLQDVFSDITEPIVNCKAEIYQYVGDEVIISWHQDKIVDRSLCLKVFFEIENELETKKENYLQKYQTLPQFKAGAHIGNAVAGEIGIIKRDITYSGDLLNTTARIQGKCNELGALFLI
ncbi:MAG: adenylate/guanylate cyclase domain-containing protein [Bacteroidota bacterium]